MSPGELAYLGRTDVQAILEHDLSAALERSPEGLIADLVTWPTPFEINVEDVRCPVAAVHGDLDDWEPLTNLRRFLPLLPGVELIVLEGRNHFGPFLHPDLLVSLALAPPS